MHRPLFTKLGEMNDANNEMNPLRFGRDRAETQIRIRINLEIRITTES